MNPKSIVTTALLVFVGVSIGYMVLGQRQPTEPPPPVDVAESVVEAQAGNSAATQPHKVVAYYFHGTQRCATCLSIEELARETIETTFDEALRTGELEWRAVNTDEPFNEHFAEEYELVTSSLVIVDIYDGEERAYTNMQRVWELVHEEQAAFRAYVAAQVRAYLES